MSGARMSDDEEAVHHPICRGCAGRGVGQHVSPREIQLLGGMGWWFDPPPNTRRRPRVVRVAVFRYDQRNKQGVLLAPLLLCIREIERLESEGYTLSADNPILPTMQMVCSWCSGTGEKMLSAAAMRQALSA